MHDASTFRCIHVEKKMDFGNGRRAAGKKGKGETPRTHQVMSSNLWEVVTPKWGLPA